jgi:hypothetical protein
LEEVTLRREHQRESQKPGTEVTEKQFFPHDQPVRMSLSNEPIKEGRTGGYWINAYAHWCPIPENTATTSLRSGETGDS